jgi:hypothetical protein
MKKIIMIISVGWLSTISAQSQTFAEWFQQKKTQISYLINQIAAYEVYAGYLEKGYGIAASGLTFISDMKKGEFDLHNAFFTALKTVNPAIARYSRIADIISYETSITSNFKKIMQLKNMSAGELNYLNAVCKNMTGECSKSIDELIDLITDDTYTLKDNERIRRIDMIYDDIKDKYAFTKSFADEAQVLSINRQTELNTIEMSSINNGLK